jgi:hypothetical protein
MFGGCGAVNRHLRSYVETASADEARARVRPVVRSAVRDGEETEIFTPVVSAPANPYKVITDAYKYAHAFHALYSDYYIFLLFLLFFYILLIFFLLFLILFVCVVILNKLTILNKNITFCLGIYQGSAGECTSATAGAAAGPADSCVGDGPRRLQPLPPELPPRTRPLHCCLCPHCARAESRLSCLFLFFLYGSSSSRAP